MMYSYKITKKRDLQMKKKKELKYSTTEFMIQAESYMFVAS